MALRWRGRWSRHRRSGLAGDRVATDPALELTRALPDELVGLRGSILGVLGRPEEALAEYRRVAETDGSSSAAKTRAALQLGMALARVGRADEAESAYRTAVAIGDPEVLPAAQACLGEFLAEQAGHEDEAKVVLQAAIASGDGYQAPRAASALATVLVRLGRDDEAEDTLRQGLVVGGGTGAEAGMQLAAFLVERGRDVDAVAVYSTIVEMDGGRHAPPAATPLAELLDRIGRPGDADEVRAAAERWSNPDAEIEDHLSLGFLIEFGALDEQPQALLAVADYHRARGDLAEAESAYRRAAASPDEEIATKAQESLETLHPKDP